MLIYYSKFVNRDPLTITIVYIPDCRVAPSGDAEGRTTIIGECRSRISGSGFCVRVIFWLGRGRGETTVRVFVRVSSLFRFFLIPIDGTIFAEYFSGVLFLFIPQLA